MDDKSKRTKKDPETLEASKILLGEPEEDECIIYKNDIVKSMDESYIIHSYIAQGGFSKVYKATQVRTGTSVALKIISIDSGDKRAHYFEDYIMRILTGDKGSEHFILEIVDCCIFRGFRCLVTELLSVTLEELMEMEKQLPIHVIRSITYQMVQALSKLEQHGIIHADLKPDNIMLVDHCKYPYIVKLADFGSAVFIDEIKHFVYLQSLAYRAPEVIMGCKTDGKIDMWSLGCIIAELFSGSLLLPGDNEYQKLCCISEHIEMPPDYMIAEADNCNMFFSWQMSNNDGQTWVIKSKEEYYKDGIPKPRECEVVKPVVKVL